MLPRLTRFTPSLIAVGVIANLLSPPAIAQDIAPVEPFQPPSVPDAIDEVFNFQWSGLHDWDLPGQLNWMFGWYNFPDGSYPENAIARDMEFLDIVYRDILQQQVGNDPVMRTRDLANPYASSIGQNPCYYSPGPVGCQQPEPAPTFVAPPPQTPPPVEPVPALW